LIDAIPIAETTKSNEWMTRGKRMKPDASVKHQIAEH
jgi:hypothetical protein